jgi:hypothetical protein
MDKWILPVMDSMVASMIGDIEPHKHMNGMEWDDFPKELPKHRQVLKSVEWCTKNEIKPMPDTIASHMVSEGFDKGEVEEFLSSLLSLRDDNQAEQLKSTSIIVHNWLKGFQADKAWEDATHVWNGSGTYEEKVEAIESLLSSVRPESEKIFQYSQEEMYENFLEELIELWRNKENKGEVGPTLPYEAADAYFSRFKWNEISSFIAMTGWGKTMFAMDIAEHIAWEQDFVCDVCVILLETDPINIQKRQFAKKALVPYTELETGNIDVESDKYKPIFNKFYKNYVMKNDTGRLYYAYIPQPTIRSVLTAMDIHASMNMRTNGRPIFFIIDYLQKIQPIYRHEMEAKHNFYESCAEQIASKTRILSKLYHPVKAHTMIFAQENPDTGETFGSKTLRQKSQMMFSLKRFEITNDENQDQPMMYKGKVMKDSLGNERFWHRKNGGLSSRAELHNIKSNDAEQFVLHLKIETAMGFITQNINQLKELRAQGRLTTRRHGNATTKTNNSSQRKRKW